MNFDVTGIVQAAIFFVAALVGGALIPWLNAKFGAEKTEEFLRWVEIGVAAAEQLFGSADGLKKKIYVVNYLKEKGYTADVEDIENAIEAAVLRLHKELYGGAADAEQS